MHGKTLNKLVTKVQNKFPPIKILSFHFLETKDLLDVLCVLMIIEFNTISYFNNIALCLNPI